MRYAWDCFRWRFIAAFHIAWWVLKGAPQTPYELDGKRFYVGTRWEEAKTAWRLWRAVIMRKHTPYVTADEFFAKLDARTPETPDDD